MSNSSRSSLARLLETRAGRLACLALAALALWLAVTPAAARGLIAARLAQAPAQLPEQVQEPKQTSRTQRFESPRDIGRALHDYLDSSRIPDTGTSRRAIEVFDLRDLPAARQRTQGQYLLLRLERILDRVQALAPDGAPFASEAEVGGDTYSWTGRPPGRPDIAVRLGFERGEDGWHIDGDTVERLDALASSVEDLPRLAGLRDQPVSPAELLRHWVPDRLERGGFLLRSYQWIGLAALVLLALVFERVLLFLLRPLLKRVTKGEGSLYEELLGNFERPVGCVIGTLLFLAGLPVLDIEPRYRETLELGASVVLAVGGVWATYRLVDVVSWHLERRALRTDNRFDDMLVPLLRRTLKVLVLIVGVVFVASRLTTDLWGVFAGLSIGSLALGFAAKDSVENLFGTFTVLLDNPFKLGDLVKVGGYNGTIEQVGFRSTRLRTDQDTLVTMPNSRFIASDIENFSQRRRRRVEFVLGVTYDTPPHTLEAFCEGLRELVRRHPWSYKQDFQAWFENFGPVSLDVRLVCYLEGLDVATYQRERHRLSLDILRLAGELEVAFAFPTQTIHMAPEAPAARSRTPADLARAVAEGRRAGAELGRLALEPFGLERPGPVRFDPDLPDAQGPLPPRP